MRILVTGATGYVGGQLVPRLLAAGHAVRVLARDPARLAGRPWADAVEAVRGDVLRPDTLPAALAGVDAAYYLVHSMGGSAAFEERDLTAAANFGAAAKAAGVSRVIYLGGLGDDRDAQLSKHLASRQSTGARLRETGPPVTEFRAAVIVGAGSISFELVRYLTERLPVMICPRWVMTRIQPIAIADVLEYLARALEVPASAGEIVEIGGADVLTYRDMILGYAAARGLKRRLIEVPVLTPRLSSYWVHAVTPIPTSIARPLIEGLGTEVVVRGDHARRLFPEIRPLTYSEALRAALAGLDSELQSTWSDSLASSQGDVAPVLLTTHEGMILERRQVEVAAPASAVFSAFTGLGGRRGWLYGTWLWWLRGLLDRLVGGVGMRRGRRHPDLVRAGDALDFWRVEEVQPGTLLRLRAEMKVPGRAWLEFRAKAADGRPRTTLVQTAYFAPRGLAGHAYWYVLYPIHAVIFSKLVARVAERAQRIAAGAER